MNKNRLEIIYSIAVLIIIPLLLAMNTILLATSTRNNYDKELQSRAELANTVLAESLTKEIIEQNSALIQSKLKGLNQSQNELKNMLVIVNNNSGYEILASAGQENEISSTDEIQYDIVYSRKWPVAKSVSVVDQNGTEARAWNVASPVIDEQDEVVGIVVSDLLTTDVDETFDATLQTSFLIMIASAVAVLILLFNHFKFVGYASLLKKQKELNQTMSDFLSVATHELKAPMSIIKGYISNVNDGTFGDIPEEAKKQLDVAFAQTDRLNELVQDLLNVSRIEQGRIEFDIKPVQVVSVLQPIIKNYQSIASEKNITIESNVAEDVWVQADAGRLQEILTNLIDNAVKYSRSGNVNVTYRDLAKMISVSVRDTGIGMTADERARLFQRFYRVKNDDTKNISGTGLGLWIIKQYIEKMGGSISVDSLVGSGSEFTVKLKKANPQQ